ncbi:bacterio-opsin activator [Natrinema sp. CBA1119]|uniref:helix-turn-helix domain-containing protein n=1 Tax=Natrinema sp. CBA1119 TaxID=1608465 RepID=UPI000BF3191B|nr:helix-turn-helix domain-containing protein [Natrinema sp. CBA1119]PGF16393.1 bacterio-opsin activator [Natrinema sp. CBA1119]
MGQTVSEESPNRQHRPVTEVEFDIRSGAYPFIRASETEACTFELAEMVPRNDGRYSEFFNVTDAAPARISSLAATRDTVDVTLLREYEDGALFEFCVSGNCPAFALAELGALPREIESVNGNGRITAEIPPQYDPSAVIDGFLEEVPDAELTAKRTKDTVRPLFTPSAFSQVLSTTLTDRQSEVLRAAFEAGYYEWPRECTGADVAAALDIASATFSEHIHAAERKLLTALFDGR